MICLIMRYLIDEDGMIVQAMDKVKAADNPQEMLDMLGRKGLKEGDHP